MPKLPSDTVPSTDVSPTRWKHRRRLAYLAMSSMIAVTTVVLTPLVAETRVQTASDALSWFYFAMASIVGAYVGFATWADKK
jgi:polyferredoxin